MSGPKKVSVIAIKSRFLLSSKASRSEVLFTILLAFMHTHDTEEE